MSFTVLSEIDLSSIPWPVIGAGSGWSLFATGLLLFIKGALLPRSTVDLWLEIKDKSASEWHAAYLASEETNRLQARQIDELLEIARRDAKVLELIESTLRDSPHANT